MRVIDTDFFVIGSGVAGLIAAIRLSEHGRVVLVTKKERADSSTNYAQGGIASVVAPSDSLEEHVQDTLRAGAGLCDEAVVREIVSDGPAAIGELESLGVVFSTREEGEGSAYDLGREGGHSRRRVLHAGDITGRAIEETLLERLQSCPRVTVLERAMAIDLITTGWLQALGRDTGAWHAEGSRCLGAYVLLWERGEILAVRAPWTVLATGGGGKVYLYTSNPDIATGDGVAMAWRAGLPIRNMEFIQFHPTCLYHPDAKSFLVSEAVRGEGAHLVSAAGRRFMQAVDPAAELAPRDVVARAIDAEMKTTGAPCVFLDIRHRGAAFIEERFPNISATCRRYGIDMSRDLVPVVSAAHYFCGGVEADVDGRTAMPGLLACGEVACTGLHGANRLASNSLLEAVVCSRRLARLAAAAPRLPGGLPSVPDWQYGDAVASDEAIVVEHNWNEVRTCMWDYVGIVRTDRRLARAARRIRNLREEIRQYYKDTLVTPDLLELRNIAAVAELIIRSARLRRESRGLHFTLDYPEAAGESRDTVLRDPPGGDCRLSADD